MSRLIGVAGVLAVALLSACGSDAAGIPPATTDASAPVAPSAAPSAAAPEGTSRSAAASIAAPTATDQGTTLPDWSAQKLVRTAELRIGVMDLAKAANVADSIARRTGSLVADRSSRSVRDRVNQTDLVLRVPSDSLAVALTALRTLGEVRFEQVTTQDITKSYADLDTRIAVKEQTVGRLRALLETRTAKLADVVEVERELGRAIAELEEMKGSRRYYDQQLAMSTVTLHLELAGGASTGEFVAPIAESLARSGAVLGRSISAVIDVVVILLPWGLVGGLIWAVFARVRQHNKSNARS